MNLATIFADWVVSKGAFVCCSLVAVGIWFGSQQSANAAVINAQSASRTDVGAAVALADDGDTVLVPAGSATWTSTLTITKNISLIGAGEGQTIINENLTRTGNPPLISLSLTKEMAAPAYSFRLSGFTFRSANPADLPSGNAFVKLNGTSSYGDHPYVLGCVSRVRVDHVTFDKMNGSAMIIDSVLGVADHVTIDNGTRSNAPTKVFMHNWTPTVYDDNGNISPVTMTTLAVDAYGSWADDPYFGTDKFWFWEDCNFTVDPSTNVSDNQEGGRIVFRHCTMNGGSCATHGMEGPRAPGVRAQEVYNNYFNVTGQRILAQTRSGTILVFNNLFQDVKPSGWPFHNYRLIEWWENWGAASGDNRYDDNVGGSPIYTGTVTLTTGYGSITDSSKANYNLINTSDGYYYSVNNLSQAMNSNFGGPSGTADPGWKWLHSAVQSVSGKTITLDYQIDGNGSPQWKVGDSYEIRKVRAVWGQIGLGKGTMMSPKGAGKGSYETYPWPNTSGTKITFPNAGYPLEPAYAWNNYNIGSATYLGFDKTNEVTIMEGRDFFSLGHITPETTQKVGYPEQDYTHATSNYPKIGPGQTISYTPYTYPHPLVSGAEGPMAPENLKIVP